MSRRLRSSLAGTAGVFALIAITFLIAGLELLPALSCALAVGLLVVFPVAYAIASALPRAFPAKTVPPKSHDESTSEAYIEVESPEQAPSEAIPKKPIWWVTLLVGSLALLVFATADWVMDSQLSVTKILLGLVLLFAGIAQRAGSRRGPQS